MQRYFRRGLAVDLSMVKRQIYNNSRAHTPMEGHAGKSCWLVDVGCKGRRAHAAKKILEALQPVGMTGLDPSGACTSCCTEEGAFNRASLQRDRAKVILLIAVLAELPIFWTPARLGGDAALRHADDRRMVLIEVRRPPLVKRPPRPIGEHALMPGCWTTAIAPV